MFLPPAKVCFEYLWFACAELFLWSSLGLVLDFIAVPNARWLRADNDEADAQGIN